MEVLPSGSILGDAAGPRFPGERSLGDVVMGWFDRSLFIVLSALIGIGGTISAASAQQAMPAERIPEGRRVAGWAVETFPALERIYRSSTTHRVLLTYFGVRGLQTVSVPTDRLAYSGPGAMTGVQVGRAFLKVDQPGEAVFIMEMSQLGQGGYSCLAELRVGGVDAGSLNFYASSRPKSPVVQSAKTIFLSIGYYTVEYVAVCNGSPSSFAIQTRDAGDARHRPFRPDELFHVKL